MAGVALDLGVLFAGPLRGQGKRGVISYFMDNGSGSAAARRWAAVGKIGGRTSEIQRLIGRSLRAIVDLGLLNEK